MIFSRAVLLTILVSLGASALWSTADFRVTQMLLHAVLFLGAGLLFFPRRSASRPSPLLEALKWCAWVAAGFYLSMILKLDNVNLYQIALLALGLGTVLLASCTAILALDIYGTDRRQTGVVVLPIVAVLTAAPLWLGPFILLMPENQWISSSILALSPLTFLSLLIDADYLRIDWFYQNSPFGGMRFSYPSLVILALCYAFLIVLLAGTCQYYLRRNVYKQ